MYNNAFCHEDCQSVSRPDPPKVNIKRVLDHLKLAPLKYGWSMLWRILVFDWANRIFADWEVTRPMCFLYIPADFLWFLSLTDLELACSAGVFWVGESLLIGSLRWSRHLWFYDRGRLGRVESPHFLLSSGVSTWRFKKPFARARRKRLHCRLI